MASDATICRATGPIVSVLIAGLAFSIALYTLGIDIESPEILRYMLIGTVPLTAVLTYALTALQIRSTRQTIAAALVLGAIMCVPMESLVYVLSVWKLQRSEAFGRDHLPTLIAILIGWTVVVAAISSIGRFAIRIGRNLLRGKVDP